MLVISLRMYLIHAHAIRGTRSLSPPFDACIVISHRADTLPHPIPIQTPNTTPSIQARMHSPINPLPPPSSSSSSKYSLQLNVP